MKFQTFSPDKLVSSAAATTPYQRDRGGSSDQRSLLEALTLPKEAWVELRDHATEAGTTFLSTPFDLDSAEMLVDLGLPALKVSSGELTNLPYLREMSQLGVVAARLDRHGHRRTRSRPPSRRARTRRAWSSSTASRPTRRPWRSATCASSRA